jgi:GT2 family glycosyltransferase
MIGMTEDVAGSGRTARDSGEAPRVAVLVLHYANWPTVAATIEDVQAQTAPISRLILVDNASPPWQIELAQERFPDLEVRVARENRGYAAGMNAALRLVLNEVDFVLLLTHEVRMTPEVLGQLMSHMREHPMTGACGPVLGWRSRQEVVFSAGGETVGRSRVLRHAGSGSDMHAVDAERPLQAAFLDGSCVLYRKKCLERAGLFDEGYFLCFEEAELHHRIRSLGWDVVVVPRARALQEPSQRALALWTRNRLRYVSSCFGPRAALREVLRQLYLLYRDFRTARNPLRVAARIFGIVGWLLPIDPRLLARGPRL